MPKAKDKEAKERWFGMRLTPMQKSKIERLAAQKGTTQKAAVLEAVERELAEEEKPVEPQPGSVLELTQDLCGSVEGPGDLSKNPEHMEDYGKD